MRARDPSTTAGPVHIETRCSQSKRDGCSYLVRPNRHTRVSEFWRNEIPTQVFQRTALSHAAKQNASLPNRRPSTIRLASHARRVNCRHKWDCWRSFPASSSNHNRQTSPHNIQQHCPPCAVLPRERRLPKTLGCPPYNCASQKTLHTQG
jgi:hypothetical protein